MENQSVTMLYQLVSIVNNNKLYHALTEKARKDLKSQQQQNGASKKETEETDDPTQDVKQTL